MPKLAGKCLCGKVHYSVEDEFEYFIYCHCKQCQESTGSAFNAAAGIGENKFAVTAGEDHLTTYNKKNVDSTISVVKFCKICGSSLFSIKTQPDRTEKVIQIRMGTLGASPTIDNPEAAATKAHPQGHVWVSENAPWFEIKEKKPLPQYPVAAPVPSESGPVYWQPEPKV